ncbi:hypothetical protein JCM16358_00330 [Halanaerocella petrolearia]
MDRIKNKQLVLLVVLLGSMLIFVGCNNKKVVNVNVQVTDQQGQPVKNAKVRFNDQTEAVTDKNGLVSKKLLVKDLKNYQLTVTKRGYKKISKSLTSLDSGNLLNQSKDAIISITLKKKNFDATIKVKDREGNKLEAKATVINSDKTISKEINIEGVSQIKQLPPDKYKLKVTKDGYIGATEEFEIKDEDLTVRIPLKKKEIEKFDATIMVKDKSGKMLDAQITVTDDNKTITRETQQLGLLQIKDLSPGKYQVKVTKKGYRKITEELIINQDDLLVINLKKKRMENDGQKIDNGDLKINITDVNHNKLSTQVILKKNGKVKSKKQGSEVEFLDLATGKYEVNISRKGYQDWSKKLKLDQKEMQLDVIVKGGRVRQYLIGNQNKNKTIAVENLVKDEEVVVALSYLDWANIPHNLIYKVRRKGNKLIKRYGSDFAVSNLDYSIGDTEEFEMPSKVKEKNVTATLAAIGKHVYVFVDNQVEIRQQKVDKLVSQFDNRIHPQIANKNNQNKTAILLTDFSDYHMTGYFDPADLYPDLGNEVPIFYLNADRTKNTLLTAATHQYQHLNFFTAKAKAGRITNDAWINQGMAQLAPQLLGYINPEKKGWSQDHGNGWVYSKDYGYLNNTEEVNLLVQDGSLPYIGGSSLFVNYLLDQYGKELLNKIMISSQSPRDVIEDYTGRRFNKIYLNWVTTNLTDTIEGVDNQVYNYSKFDLQMSPNLKKKEINKLGVNYFKITDQEGMVIIKRPADIKGEIGVIIIRKPKN